MEALKTNKKKNYHQRLNSLPTLKFRKFQMNMDKTGVHILISANFLKKGNHSVRVQNGMLHLKIKRSIDLVGYANNAISQGVHDKDMDFKICLPQKKYWHINSVRFQNGNLQIHLVDGYREGAAIKYAEPSRISNFITSSVPY